MGTALRIVASEFAGVDEIGLSSFLESNLVTSVCLLCAGVNCCRGTHQLFDIPLYKDGFKCSIIH